VRILQQARVEAARMSQNPDQPRATAEPAS
jgi:hypothetical protein